MWRESCSDSTTRVKNRRSLLAQRTPVRYNGTMPSSEEKHESAAGLEDEIAEVCGMLNVATGRLVSLIAKVLDTEEWAGAGIRSPEQWVAWKCGVSLGRAR